MANRENQIYEEYWKYTAAWTNIHGDNFRNALSVCVDYFNNNSIHPYSKSSYQSLQMEVVNVTGLSPVSVRKAINQFVKLGFLKPLMQGINIEAQEFCKSRNTEGRTIALSKSVYKHANFQNSMSKECSEWNEQMSFLIRTLQECGSLSKDDLIAIMTYDYTSSKKHYLSKEELIKLYESAKANGFIGRKYNQISHLMNLLASLDNLRKKKGVIYFETDAREIFGDEEIKSLSKTRDPYLQREFKRELILESGGKCMVENIDYPMLIASHIRPYKDCRDKKDAFAVFDVNNGLLLSKNIDSLFDLGYITFNNDGTIHTSNSLSDSVKKHIGELRLSNQYLNIERLKYLKIHRKLVFDKRYKNK